MLHNFEYLAYSACRLPHVTYPGFTDFGQKSKKTFPHSFADCPSLLCEELEDLETKNHQGRRREGEERVFNQTEDDEAGEETGQEHEEGEEERKRKDVGLENELMATEEEEQVRPESRLGAEEAQEEAKETKSLEEKNEKKKGRKRRGRKLSERVRNRRGYKDVSECYEEESQIQEASAMSSEESSAPAEPPIGLMNSCDLSDPVLLGCGGAGLYCPPPAPLPLLYSSQPPVPIQPAPPLPHGKKRPRSPSVLYSHSLQGPRPHEVRLHRHSLSITAGNVNIYSMLNNI